MAKIVILGRKIDRYFFRHMAVGKSQHPILQMMRYGLVVGIAAPIDLGGYIILKSVFGLHYILAATISFTTSLLVNYLLSVVWVFNSQTHGKRKRLDAGIFAIIGFVGLGLTDLIIWILTDHLKVNFVISKLIAFVIVFFWSFGSRRWLFTPRQEKISPPADVV